MSDENPNLGSSVHLPEPVLRESYELLNAEDRADWNVLLSAVNRAATIYRDQKRVRETEVSSAEIRKQRRKLLKTVTDLDATFEAAKGEVLTYVGQGFDRVIIDQDYEHHSTARLATLVRELRAFRAHLEDHADQSPVSKGPSARPELDTLIEALLDLWEAWLEAPITHSASKDSIYEGTPQSVAGRYVTRLVKVIDPEIPETRIARALSVILKRAREEESAMRPALKLNRLGS